MARFTIALMWVCLAVLGGPAYSQSSEISAEAKKHFERGLQLYQVELYEHAVVEFNSGYQLAPRPEFLYARGQAQRMNKDCRAAIASYEAFLRTGPAPRHEAVARVQLEVCRAAIGAVGETIAPVSRSTNATAAHPRPEPILVPALVEKRNDSPPQIAAATTDRSSPAPVTRRWWLWAIVGGAVAAGLGVAVAAGAFNHQMDAPCPHGRECIP